MLLFWSKFTFWGCEGCSSLPDAPLSFTSVRRLDFPVYSLILFIIEVVIVEITFWEDGKGAIFPSSSQLYHHISKPFIFYYYILLQCRVWVQLVSDEGEERSVKMLTFFSCPILWCLSSFRKLLCYMLCSCVCVLFDEQEFASVTFSCVLCVVCLLFDVFISFWRWFW